MTALESFTRQIVDYAGLFPPAGLPMDVVVSNYAKYVQRADADMLARLIVPASRLAEFEEASADLLPKDADKQPWRISGLIPPVDSPNDAFKFSVSGIEQFNKRHSDPTNGLAIVDVVEVKAPTEMHLRSTAAMLPWNLKAFLEIPHADDPTELVDQIASLNSVEGGRRFFAKMRTGGMTQELIPPGEQVARFISVCAERFVGFKATAGLHHPIRGEYRLTYKPNAESGTMHGFLNVFAASCFAFAGFGNELVKQIMTVDDATEFRFDDDGLTFDGNTVSSRKIQAIRSQFALSFGSCSFDEPSNELNELNMNQTTTA